VQNYGHGGYDKAFHEKAGRCHADMRSRSGRRSRSLPRLFRTSPLRCHSLKRRLVVNSVTFAVSANSSFVTSSSKPPETFRPIRGAMVVSTWPSRCRALWLVNALWLSSCSAKYSNAVCITNRCPEVVREALRVGGCGYVVKSDAASDLPAALETVMGNKLFVGRRFLANGLSELAGS
jgi:hypothetical protein